MRRLKSLAEELDRIRNKKGWFYPEIRDCRKWYRLINAEIFSSSLDKIAEFEIRRIHKAYAYFDYSNGYYILNRRYSSKVKFVEILAHEMVHHWQMVYDLKVNHGSSFYMWTDRFADFGLDLRRIPKGTEMGKSLRNNYDDDYRLDNKKSQFKQIREKRLEKTQTPSWWLPNEETTADEENFKQRRKPH